MATSSDANASLFTFSTVSVIATTPTIDSVSDKQTDPEGHAPGAVFFQFVEKGFRADRQHRRRARPIVPRMTQRKRDQGALRLFNRHAWLQHDGIP